MLNLKTNHDDKEFQNAAKYQTIMPYLIVMEAAKFIGFIEKVFDAKQTHKTMRDENRIMHTEIMIDECTIMFADST